MDVKMPDGTIIRGVPEGTTRAQLMARYGKTQQAQSRAKGTGIGLIDNALSSINEALIGAPEAIYNAAAAVTDPVAELIVGKEAVRHAQGQRRAAGDAARRALVSREMPIARDVGRIAGAAMIPLPGKKLQEGGRIARGAYRAMQGAVGGAGVREADQSAVAPAAIGAATNVALPPVLRMLANTGPGRAVTSAVGKVAQPVVNYLTGAPKPALPAATRALEPLGRKAEARAARFKAAGVENPTTAMVTRNPSAFKLERKLGQVEGAGDELSQQMQDVEQSLVRSGRNLVDRMGGAKGDEAVGKAGQDVLDTKRGEMQQVTSRLYDKVREERGDESVGRLESFLEAFEQPDLVDDAEFETMRRSILNRLRRYGETNAKQYADAFGKAPAKARQAKPGSSIKDLPPPYAPDEYATLETRRFPTAGGTRYQHQRGPVDLVGFLRSQGGIRDQGGELSHLGINNARRKLDFTGAEGFLGGLVKRDGMTLDEAAHRAWEAGYFPNHASRPGIDDFLDALRETHAGRTRSFLPDDLEELGRFEAARDARYSIEANSASAERLGVPAGQDDYYAVPAGAYDVAPSYTVRQAEELRKFIGGLGGVSPNARRMRGMLIDALDDDVVGAVGDDAFKAARASAKARFQEFQKTAAGRIADEKIPAEKLTQRLLSMSLDDLRSVKKSYLTGTDTQVERGAKAWKDLQAQGVDDLLKSAISDEGSISGTKLLNTFKNRSANLRELLEPADYKRLRRLVLATRDAVVAPPTSSAYGSDTAPMMLNLLEGVSSPVKKSWLSFLGRVGAHGVVGAASGPLGNVALEAGRVTAGTIAERKAAQALARRVELAKSPEAMAKAVQALRKAAEKNPAAASLLERVTGGTAAATANQ